MSWSMEGGRAGFWKKLRRIEGGNNQHNNGEKEIGEYVFYMEREVNITYNITGYQSLFESSKQHGRKRHGKAAVREKISSRRGEKGKCPE